MAGSVSKTFPSFSGCFLAALESQQKNGDFCDCSVIVDDTKFVAHKCVLSANSGFINKKFRQNPAESVIDLTQIITKSAFSVILSYLYSGCLSFDGCLLNDVKASADVLELKDVSEFCRNVELNLQLCKADAENNVDGGVSHEYEEENGDMDVRGNGCSVVGCVEKSVDQCKRNATYDENGSDELQGSIKCEESVTQESVDDANGAQLLEEVKPQKLPVNDSWLCPTKKGRLRRAARKMNNPKKCHISGSNLFSDDVVNSNEILACKKMQTKTVECSYCSRKFLNAAQMTKHQEAHKRGDIRHCSLCSKSFQRLCDYTRHVHSHSSLSCDWCSFQTMHSREFLEHSIREHDQPKPYACSHGKCGFRTNNQSQLEKHYAIHSSVRPYVCQICGKDFVHKNSIACHMQSCLKKKEFLCDLCGRSFNHVGSLNSHRRIHNGEKPYVCTDCNSRFSDHRNLKRHRRIHENIYPYVCGFCNKCFRHSNTLKMHIQRQHDPNFDCSLKDFSKGNVTEVEFDGLSKSPGSSMRFVDINDIDRHLHGENPHKDTHDAGSADKVDDYEPNKYNESEYSKFAMPFCDGSATVFGKAPQSQYVCLRNANSGGYTFIVGGNQNRNYSAIDQSRDSSVTNEEYLRPPSGASFRQSTYGAGVSSRVSPKISPGPLRIPSCDVAVVNRDKSSPDTHEGIGKPLHSLPNSLHSYFDT